MDKNSHRIGFPVFLERTVLGLFFIFTLASVFGQTAADFNVALTEDGTGVVITQYTGKATRVQIPSSIQNMPVKEIGPYAFNPAPSRLRNIVNVTSVIIPNGVTAIGDNAFMMQQQLVSITIPSSVKSIGNGVFLNCSKLTEITIPRGIARIGDQAFSGCIALKSISLPEGLTEINDSAFSSCKALASIALPSTLKKLGLEAFANCTNLTAITIPESLKVIEFDGWNQFIGCSKLPLTVQAALKRLGYTHSF